MSRVAAAAGSGARRGLVVAFALPERAAQLLREARWILFIALALFLALILFTYDRNDPGWSHAVSSHSIQNAGGRVGACKACR